MLKSVILRTLLKQCCGRWITEGKRREAESGVHSLSEMRTYPPTSNTQTHSKLTIHKSSKLEE